MNESTTDTLAGDILIVDDTPANLRLLAELLSARGYRVRAVLSGERALAAVASTPPDLILLDIRMPGMDGYEVCRRLKNDPATLDIPVLFISALDDTADKVQGFSAGAVDYISKPVQAEEVLARVKTHLMLARLRHTLQEQLVERDRLIDELNAYAHTVAHDLKGPLAVMVGYADYLHESYRSMQSEEIGMFAETMLTGSQKLVGIVNGLLLLASARHEDIPITPLDMSAVVAETLARLKTELESSQAQLTVPASWPKALGYAPWVEEIWANYLSNAIKYGGRPAEEGRSAPCIELGCEPPSDGQIRFWVHDDGAGVPQSEQAQLFTPFAHLSQRRPDSHGLGLSIVQRIAERLGGHVGVESRPGAGSTFSFTLPAATP